MKIEKMLSVGSEAFNYKHRKETKFYKSFSLVVLTPQNEIKALLDLRLYMTNARIYAACWLLEDSHASATGWAGGYGYHKESAAAADALEKIFQFDKNFSGSGETESALEAVAHYFGYKTFKVILAHG